MEPNVLKVNRRDFLKFTGLTTGGLVLGFNLGGCSPKEGTLAPNIFLELNSNGQSNIVCHRSEMGQGIRTCLVQMMADELELPLDNVNIVQAIGDVKYGDQNTDGSKSIRTNWTRLREMSAATRQMLEQAAAKKWKVEAGKCKAEMGKVMGPSGKSATFSELIFEASKLPVPNKPKLKSKSEFKYIGKGLTGLDVPAYSSGKAVFGMDVEMDGMVHVSLLRSPVPGGVVKKITNKDEILAMDEITKIIQLSAIKQDGNTSNAVGIVANNTWSAIEACKKLNVQWDMTNGLKMDDKQMRAAFAKELKKSKPGKVYRSEDKKTGKKPKSYYSAQFYTPYLVHAPMEPLVATAEVTMGKCEVWAPTQHPQRAQAAIAKFLSMPKEKVIVNVTFLGGGFGRKSQPDFILEAVGAAKQLGKPVKLTWSREDEIKHGFYHPSALQKITVGLDENGMPLTWKHKSVFSSMLSVFTPIVKEPADWEMGLGATTLPYNLDKLSIEGSHVETPVRRGWMRAVHNLFHAFSIGTAIDELARKKGMDPIDYSLKALGPDRNVGDQQIARLKAVINKVRSFSNWDKRKAEGKLLGFAHHYSFRSYLAFVVEVEKTDDPIPKITRVHGVLDCGHYVNENIVKAQLEGSVAFGMSIVDYGNITLDEEGKIAQNNFDDYPVIRNSEMPEINLHLMDNEFAPEGVGEPGVPAFMPAYTNAVARALGKPVRTLPLKA